MQKGQAPTFENQLRNSRHTAEVLARVAREHSLVVTHGNGPQVGLEFFRHVAARELYPVYPFDALGASTQGWIGYLLERGLRLAHPGFRVATLVTMVRVSRRDPAFRDPTKPIGSFFTREEALALSQRFGWTVREDAGRGWRVVVPSPWPKQIVNADAIRTLLDAGYTVIAAGGGGIPVVRSVGGYKGVFAVIDKDRASAVLARDIRAEALIILTQVDGIYVNWGKPNQRKLEQLSAEELWELAGEGHFGRGSMYPKVEAVIWFLRNGGKWAAVGSLEEAEDVVAGRRGTRIFP